MSDFEWELIATNDEIEGKQRLSVIVDETPALLIQLGSFWYVMEDVCTHDGQPLTDGEIVDGEIKCPRHGARFDIKTGVAKCMPATQPIRIFEVSVREDGLYSRPYSEKDLKSMQETNELEEIEGEGASESPSLVPLDLSPPEPESSELNLDERGLPNETAMLDALKTVIDPELFVNIVDLGLIYDISRKEENENEVVLTMTLTSPACPAGPQLISQAKAALESLPGVNEAEIKMTLSPPWAPEMMTEEARDQLGIF